MEYITKFIQDFKDAIVGLLGGTILPAAAAVAVLVIIWGGLLYIQNRPEEGKNAITAAIVGLFIISLAVVIINLVISAFH